MYHQCFTGFPISQMLSNRFILCARWGRARPAFRLQTEMILADCDSLALAAMIERLEREHLVVPGGILSKLDFIGERKRSQTKISRMFGLRNGKFNAATMYREGTPLQGQLGLRILF